MAFTTATHEHSIVAARTRMARRSAREHATAGLLDAMRSRNAVLVPAPAGREFPVILCDDAPTRGLGLRNAFYKRLRRHGGVIHRKSLANAAEAAQYPLPARKVLRTGARDCPRFLDGTGPALRPSMDERATEDEPGVGSTGDVINFYVVIHVDGTTSTEFLSTADAARFDAVAGGWLGDAPRRIAPLPVALATVLADALISFVLRHSERPE